MRLMHIVSAVIWLSAIVIMFTRWSFGEPVSMAGKGLVIYALVYTTTSLGWKALESLDELMIIFDQRMDRRPRA